MRKTRQYSRLHLDDVDCDVDADEVSPDDMLIDCSSRPVANGDLEEEIALLLNQNGDPYSNLPNADREALLEPSSDSQIDSEFERSKWQY